MLSVVFQPVLDRYRPIEMVKVLIRSTASPQQQKRVTRRFSGEPAGMIGSVPTI
jgi:hypothetical protein